MYFTSALFAFSLFAATASAEQMFFYKDENGTSHAVSSPTEIPMQYRRSSKSLGYSNYVPPAAVPCNEAAAAEGLFNQKVGEAKTPEEASEIKARFAEVKRKDEECIIKQREEHAKEQVEIMRQMQEGQGGKSSASSQNRGPAQAQSQGGGIVEY